ncbi:MAG: PcfJ domain-containing protein [Parabacteroides merdae]
MRNAHYVCPKNLKTVHDKLLKIKQEREAKLRQERNRAQSISKREKLMKDIAGFYERMEKFFGLRIEEEDIIIRPLESVTQFYQEGKVMHHCVYQNGYYRRPECLILSAKDTAGKRLETIEVNLKTLDIVQSRSFCNGVSEYRDQIVKLVKKNMNLICQKLIA